MKLKTFILFVAAVIVIGCAGNAALAAPPTNDNFINAQILHPNLTQAAGNNSEATKENAEPVHAWNRGGRSVWFKYVPTANGVLTLESTGFDTLMAIYQGNTIATLVPVAANDNRISLGSFAVFSRAVIGVQTGVTYYIAIDGKNDSNGTVDSGPFTLEYTFTTAPGNDVWAVNVSGLSNSSGFGYYTGTNVNAGKDAGEPNHAGNAGGRSIWYRIQAPAIAQSYTVTVQGTLVSDPNIPVSTLVAVY